MTTQVKEVSRNDLPAEVPFGTQAGATTATVAKKDMYEMRRRGFFVTLAATVAGAIGMNRIIPSLIVRQQTLTNEKPVVVVHPNAIARTEEGSRRHG